MTDAEQSLMKLGMQLRDGLQDMIDGGRLLLSDIPDDDQWLTRMLSEMATLAQQVEMEG